MAQKKNLKSIVLIVTKKATMQTIVSNLQKTNIGFGNFYVDNWLWWENCQSALYLLSYLISKRLGISKGFIW